MKGGIPKTPYKDDAIHITTPIYATDMSVEYFTESDKDFNSIDVGEDYFNGDYLCGFDTEEIVDIDSRPFLSDKFDITKHPKYKLLSDFDKRNAFDIEKYRSRKLVVKPTDKFDLYDMGEVEAG